MKNKRAIIALIVILSLLVIDLSIGMTILINKSFDFNFKFNFDKSNLKLVDNMTTESKDINNIKIDVYSTDIEIKKSDDNIKVEYYSNSDKNSKIVNKDNSIIIYEDEYNTGCIGFCNINRKIILYVPSDYDGKFNLKTISGDIKSFVDMENDVNINTTSGDVSLLGVMSANIETTSGNIDISKVNNMINVKTISGDISLKYLDIKENSFLKTTSGDIDINNNVSDCYVEASTISGDTYINKSNRKSDLILNIRTTSGDIVVN